MTRIFLSILFCVMLSGCQTHLRYDNSAKLITRADFNQAAVAAPAWVCAALETINDLELELERK